MEKLELKDGQVLTIRPAVIFAFLNILPLLLFSTGLLFVAWYLFSGFLLLSWGVAAFAFYRFLYII